MCGKGWRSFSYNNTDYIANDRVILGIEELTKIKPVVLKCSGNHHLVGREITQ